VCLWNLQICFRACAVKTSGEQQTRKAALALQSQRVQIRVVPACSGVYDGCVCVSSDQSGTCMQWRIWWM
jgi:hypothetical protein